MGYERYVGETLESTTELTCAVVVLTAEAPQETLGGGYFTVQKPCTDKQLEAALDDAVTLIIRKGNNAFPRDKQRIRAEFAGKPQEDTGAGRVVREHARIKNHADRGRT